MRLAWLTCTSLYPAGNGFPLARRGLGHYPASRGLSEHSTTRKNLNPPNCTEDEDDECDVVALGRASALIFFYTVTISHPKGYR